MLNKDHHKRPDLFEIARIPCVKKEILKFVEEHNCREDVIGYLDVDEINKPNNPVKPTNEPEVKQYQVERLEEWADLMRNDIKIQDYKNGWFGKHQRCCLGMDIYSWILDHVESNEEKAKYICQKMIEKEVIQNVDQKQIFNLNEIYRLYMDREDIADNLVRRWD